MNDRYDILRACEACETCETLLTWKQSKQWPKSNKTGAKADYLGLFRSRSAYRGHMNGVLEEQPSLIGGGLDTFSGFSIRYSKVLIVGGWPLYISPGLLPGSE